MVKKFFMNKKVGETPLEALLRARRARRIPPSVPMAYAGRLDPMASGKLLILVGDECKRQKEYHGLDKEYVVEVLLGLSSDTGDVLGLIEQHETSVRTKKEIQDVLQSFLGPYQSPYPRFSSKTVAGKPLFQWTLEEEEVELPLQTGTIYKMSYKGLREVTTKWLGNYVEKKTATLTPVADESKALGRDFRKADVRASWKNVLKSAARYDVITIRVHTSAGVYMRTLAEDIGKKLGTSALALSIHRTKIFS